MLTDELGASHLMNTMKRAYSDLSFISTVRMNITYSGVFIRGEKLTYYTAATSSGRAKIATAYVEFDRRWTILT